MHQRTLLVLDTEEGSGAVPFYERLGYTQAGIIPNFALTTDRVLIATVLFYKILNDVAG